MVLEAVVISGASHGCSHHSAVPTRACVGNPGLSQLRHTRISTYLNLSFSLCDASLNLLEYSELVECLWRQKSKQSLRKPLVNLQGLFVVESFWRFGITLNGASSPRLIIGLWMLGRVQKSNLPRCTWPKRVENGWKVLKCVEWCWRLGCMSLICLICLTIQNTGFTSKQPGLKWLNHPKMVV